MPALADELKYARSWIGNTETDAVFNERVDRLLSVYTDREEAINFAIEESIRHQLASFIFDQPTSITVPGVSASFGENIRALRERLDEFMMVKGSSQVNVTRLERSSPQR